MNNFQTISQFLEYNSAIDPTNADPRILVGGSQNVLIDRNRKVKIRQGYTRYGAANSAETPIRNAVTWHNSTGGELPIRFYDDELEAYIGTIDGTSVAAWTRVLASWSTTELMRFATWWDATENIDLLLMIIGDANMYEWSGGIAQVSSITGTTITKTGTATFAQNRFYTTRNKTLICVRTGTEYTYTGGESTITLTGIADTTGLVAGDILIQKIVTQSNKPAASHTNHTIFNFENQICIGSEDDNEVWISKNNDYTAYTYSTPRVAGEGGLLTLDAPSRGFGSLDKILVCFAGDDSLFRAEYESITVSTTLSETLRIKKVQTGANQGAFSPDLIAQIGNQIAYVSKEPALRLISSPEQLEGINPETLSNPVKSDFDAADFSNGFLFWHKNSLYLSEPVNSHLWMLEFVQDADGKLRRFWQPPQILPIRPLSSIAGVLYGHSNSIAETYKLFDGFSDTATDDSKLPINAIAKFAYYTGSKRGELKNFDEFFVEGNISAQTTDLDLTLYYDFGGATQTTIKTIDGTDTDITEETLINASLGQQPLGQSPLGGSLNAPDDTSRFQVIYEIAREDFLKLQPVFSTNELDRYWEIIAFGPNAQLSRRQNINIKK